VSIGASPARIVAAFFDPEALRVWWQVTRAVTTPRTLGVFAVEWEPTTGRDEILGPLGGVFRGTVLEHRAADGTFFLGDCYWLPPEGDPIGPMALEVTCAPEGATTRLRVSQTGCDRGTRWTRYYAVITPGWKSSLQALKQYLEGKPGAPAAGPAASRG
jgi:uncharacterized protein YndB with AHSA1/START domain